MNELQAFQELANDHWEVTEETVNELSNNKGEEDKKDE